MPRTGTLTGARGAIRFTWNEDREPTKEDLDSIYNAQTQKAPEEELSEIFADKPKAEAPITKTSNWLSKLNPANWESAGDIPLLMAPGATLGDIGEALDIAQKPIRTASEYYTDNPNPHLIDAVSGIFGGEGNDINTRSLRGDHVPRPIGEQAKEVLGLTPDYLPNERISLDLSNPMMPMPQVAGNKFEEGITKFLVGTGAEALTDPTNMVPIFKGAGVFGRGASFADTALTAAAASQAPVALEGAYKGIQNDDYEAILNGLFGVAVPALGAHGLNGEVPNPGKVTLSEDLPYRKGARSLQAEQLAELDNLTELGLPSEREGFKPEPVETETRPSYGSLEDIDELITNKYPERTELATPEIEPKTIITPGEGIPDIEPVRDFNLLEEQRPEPKELYVPEEVETPNINQIRANLLADEDIALRNRIRERNTIPELDDGPVVPRESLDKGLERFDNQEARSPLDIEQPEPKTLITPADELQDIEPVRTSNLITTPEESTLRPTTEPIQVETPVGVATKNKRAEKLDKIRQKLKADPATLRKQAADIALSETRADSITRKAQAEFTRPDTSNIHVLKNNSVAANSAGSGGKNISPRLFDQLVNRKHTLELDEVVTQAVDDIKTELSKTLGDTILDTDNLGPEFGSSQAGVNINHDGTNWVRYNLNAILGETRALGIKNIPELIKKSSGRLAMTLAHELVHSIKRAGEDHTDHNVAFARDLTIGGGHALDKLLDAQNRIEEVLLRNQKEVIEDYYAYHRERAGEKRTTQDTNRKNAREGSSSSIVRDEKERVRSDSGIIINDAGFKSTREQLREESKGQSLSRPERNSSVVKEKEESKGIKSRLPSAIERATLPTSEILSRLKDEKGDPTISNKVKAYEKDHEISMGEAIADRRDATKGLSKEEQASLVSVLDKGEKPLTPKVAEAASKVRELLEKVARDAKAEDVLINHRENYFPHRYDDDTWEFDYDARGFDIQNRADSSLEKARKVHNAENFRKDLTVLDDYFNEAYRRISESRHLGKSLEKVFKDAKFEGTKRGRDVRDYVESTIKRETHREKSTPFSRGASKARHLQALSDLALTAVYQPGQAAHTAAYGGMRRSLRAIARIFKDSGKELNDAIRSGALASTIKGELAAASGAEGKTAKLTKGFMYGAPTVDKWMRVHANVVGKLLIEDALSGKRGAVNDLKRLGFDRHSNPREVGKALVDKTQFRTGVMDMPAWASTPGGKLASQYSSFMYQQTRFITDLFKDPVKNAKPIARYLVGAQILGELIGDVRAALKDDDVWGEDEDEWAAILKNKRVSNPIMRALQNLSLVGGAGAVQVLMERFANSDFPQNLLGPVPNTLLEGLEKTKQSVEDESLEPLTEFGTRQIPAVGNKIANEIYQ